MNTELAADNLTCKTGAGDPQCKREANGQLRIFREPCLYCGQNFYTIDWREYKGGINGSNVPIEALSRMKSEAYVGKGAEEDYQYNTFQQLGM